MLRLVAPDRHGPPALSLQGSALSGRRDRSARATGRGGEADRRQRDLRRGSVVADDGLRRAERDRENRARGRGYDLRTAAPDLATHQVAGLLDRAQSVGAARRDVTVEELMALLAGAFAAIRHAGAETSETRSAHIAHIAHIILDGIRPRRN
ncbi:SbtR family transcriptional regulator [Nocardia sp. NPDC003726]